MKSNVPRHIWRPYSEEQQSGHQEEGSKVTEPDRRKRIPQCLSWVRSCGAAGSTWAEYAETHGLHHGEASAALSNLHRSGQIVRLKERRGGSGIYVAPAYVEGRNVAPFRANRRPPAVTEQDVADAVEEWRQGGSEDPKVLAQLIVDQAKKGKK